MNGVNGAGIITATPPDDDEDACALLRWLLSLESDQGDRGDGDDGLWQSECDDDGNWQSVPYGSFKDPGPGVPTGPGSPRY